MSQEDALTQVDREALFVAYENEVARFKYLKKNSTVDNLVFLFCTIVTPALVITALGLTISVFFFYLFGLLAPFVVALTDKRSQKASDTYDNKKFCIKKSLEEKLEQLVSTDSQLGQFYKVKDQFVYLYSDEFAYLLSAKNTLHSATLTAQNNDTHPNIFLTVDEYVSSRGSLGFRVSGSFWKDGTYDDVIEFNKKLVRAQEVINE